MSVSFHSLCGHAVDDTVSPRVHEPDEVGGGQHGQRNTNHNPHHDVYHNCKLRIVGFSQVGDDGLVYDGRIRKRRHASALPHLLERMRRRLSEVYLSEKSSIVQVVNRRDKLKKKTISKTSDDSTNNAIHSSKSGIRSVQKSFQRHVLDYLFHPNPTSK